jgi:hypothetical protein
VKTLNISGKFEGIFDLHSKDNNAEVQITMTSWTKFKKFNLYQSLIDTVKCLFYFHAFKFRDVFIFRKY